VHTFHEDASRLVEADRLDTEEHECADIDGRISPGEWDWASCHKSAVLGDDGEWQRLKVCAGNDATERWASRS